MERTPSWAEPALIPSSEGPGSDTIIGGSDPDVAVFAGNQSRYTFEPSSDGLTVTVRDTLTNDFDTVTGVETFRFSDGEITLTQDGGQLVLTGSGRADNIQVVGAVPVTIKGSGGNDAIMGGAGDDTITGGDGDDKITGGDGTSDVAVFEYDQTNYTFESSADGQTITITDTLNSYVDTVTGVETLRFKDGDIAVSLDAGQLVLTGDDTIGDNIEIVGQYPVTVKGRGFDDDLEGSSGDDTLGGGSVTTRLRAVRAMTRLMVVRATTRSRVVMATIRSPVATARATLRSLNMTRRTTRLNRRRMARRSRSRIRSTVMLIRLRVLRRCALRMAT